MRLPVSRRAALGGLLVLAVLVAVPVVWPRVLDRSTVAAPAPASATPTGSVSGTASPSPTPTASPSESPTASRTPTPTRTATPTRTTVAAKPPVEPAPTRTSRPAPTTPPAATTSTSEAQQVLRLTNAERADAGCAPLAWSAKLASAAVAHSTDLATHDYFSHTSRDGRTFSARITAAGYAWSRVAENIATGQPTPAAVVASWMSSAGHRANILDCRLTQLGVGVARSAATGHRPYWTQDFGTPR
ncbi:CAP domain-containing protein [Phycicoccus sp.]|uniref:CAP domain-containing protein n=1 Tax=Phycicoccus sp. TaxID=1902410 RepID=UPI002CB3FAF7|nr:CAP domain-containing protein [Phycicoccus sp.]HMM93478.1 CAP domain-containing protein [Phycicoccus sp.]